MSTICADAVRAAMQVPPTGPFGWHQTWLDLLFMHWPVPVAALRPHVPARLTVDTFDGVAWLGVVPFRMTNVRPTWAPRFRSLSAFAELNVRTYVHLDGEAPGVWFFSLDATNPLAVAAARAVWRLPYYLSRLGLRRDGETVSYRARRLLDPPYLRPFPTPVPARPATLDLRYRIGESLPTAQPGSLDFFLTERYCLYATARDGRLLRVRVHHRPWPLRQATLLHYRSDLVEADGLPPVTGEPLLHATPGVAVRVWDIEPV